MSAGLFYIFCDEKYIDLSGVKRIINGYFAVPQDSWNRMSSDYQTLQIPHNISRMARIEKVLHITSGVVVVTYADLNLQLLPKGERNGTNDVPNMSRYDNFWGAAVAYGLAATLGYLGRHNLQVQTIDLYYDTRSLKKRHQFALNIVVTQTLPGIVREGRRQGRLPPRFRANIRRFQPVSKAETGSTPDKFQAGVLVVDYLLRYARSLISSSGNQRIYVRDNTQVVKKYIKNFSYHGNIVHNVFHQPDCRYYRFRNCTAVFYSREEAIKEGYRPCKICNQSQREINNE